MSPRSLVLAVAILPLACGGATDSDSDIARGTGGVPTLGGTGAGGAGAGFGGTGGGIGGVGGIVGNACELPVDPGSCAASTPMFYFDAALGQCAEFLYGCEGNANRFSTALSCMDACGGGVPEFCSLAPDTGPCDGFMPSYYFDPATGRCEVFGYGGCDGNANRFATELECLATCGDVAQAQCPLYQPAGACGTEGAACTYEIYSQCLCVPRDLYWCENVPACSAAPGTGGTSAGFAPPNGTAGISSVPFRIVLPPNPTTCSCTSGTWSCVQY